MNKSVLIPVFIAFIALMTSQAVSATTLTPEDNKAKQEIISALGAAVDSKWSQYDMINGSRQSDNGSTFVVYNKSADSPVIVPPPIVCGEGTHLHDGQCMPNPPDNSTGGNNTKPPETNCGTNEEWNGMKCVCKPGYIQDSTEACVPVKPTGVPTFDPTKTVRIGMVADVDNNAGLDRQLQQLKGFNIQILVFAGDGGYSSLTAVLDKLTKNGFTKDNTVGACGNHDSCTQLAAWLGQSKPNYDVIKKNILFVALKGSDSMKCGDTQFNDAKAALQKSAKYKIVLIHQPFVTVKSDHGNNGAFSCYDPIFQQNKVDIVDEGHNHNYQRFVIGVANYVLTGTGTHDTGSKMYPVGSDNDGQGHTAAYKKTGNNGVTIVDLAIGNNTKGVNGYFVSQDGKTVLDSWSQK